MKKWPVARIGRVYSFDAAHWLPGVPQGHKCRNMHGHTYTVELVVYGEIQPQTGFVMDFAEIDKVAKGLVEKLDHRVLNDVIENPTAENIARWFMENYPTKIVERVTVWETPRCWAEVRALWAKAVV